MLNRTKWRNESISIELGLMSLFTIHYYARGWIWHIILELCLKWKYSHSLNTIDKKTTTQGNFFSQNIYYFIVWEKNESSVNYSIPKILKDKSVKKKHVFYKKDLLKYKSNAINFQIYVVFLISYSISINDTLNLWAIF